MSCFYRELRNANVCAEVQGTPINSMRDVVCLPKPLSASFVWKKAFVFSFVGKNSTLPTTHYVSHIWRSFSTKSFVGSNGFLFSCIGKFLFESRASSWWTKLFSGKPLANRIENQGFSEGKCHFVAVLWPTVLFLVSQYRLAAAICIVCSIQSLADISQFYFTIFQIHDFPQFFDRKVLCKLWILK